MASKIEWTTETWNPTTGCNKVSEGCKNCYAEVMAKRLQAIGMKGYEEGFKLKIHRDRLDKPLKKKKPTTYFVNSMSDLFHEKIPFEFIDKVFSTMEKTPQHIYQILTKRADRMMTYCTNKKVLNNILLGVSIESKKVINRIDVLREINFKKFLSIEPLLEDLGQKLNLKKIDWVIVGGESGFNARPMKKEWVMRIQKQCAIQEIPFFFKQWGAYGEDGVRRSKKANGRLLFNQEYNHIPEMDLLSDRQTIFC